MSQKLNPVVWNKIVFDSGFWKSRQETNRTVTLPAEYNQLKVTGRIESLKLQWKPGMPHKPHHYWDSDAAKWIEASAYSLGNTPDAKLEAMVDEVIELIAASQQSDGYLNTYYSSVEPGKRWTNVHVMHELYCAGHLLEAAVAYFEAVGKRRLLDVMIRYADHIDSVFGPEPGKIRGYPGHEELELALVKLYRATNEKRFLNLAEYFVNERGKQPYFFEKETLARGDDPAKNAHREVLNRDYLAEGAYALYQSHVPVREQKTAVGHAVRAMYLYTGMTDIGIEAGDESLVEACKTLWQNVTRRRMSVTGGIGPLEGCERFTFDYDLPNETAYNETCASIGLIFWAHRMLQADLNGDYGDVIEQTLYNGVLSGVSLTGDTFFYANHLEVEPGLYTNRVNRNVRMLPRRQSWFEVSCCPPNLARLVASLGGYLYTTSDAGVQVHLYAQSKGVFSIKEVETTIRQETNYPWDGSVRIVVSPAAPTAFDFTFRIPSWSKQASIKVNGSAVSVSVVKGYATINRVWTANDTVEIDFRMLPYLVEAHPSVRFDCGKAALMRGPVVYCLEETDNGKNLWDVVLAADSKFASSYEPSLLGGVVSLTSEAKSRDLSEWTDALYRPVGSGYRKREIKAIPYYTWSNRDPGEMLVWMRLGL
ncbi:MAG: beta-L-arabinofuranosidase domain-containing protein [Treponemataceae bacterium]